MDFKNVEPTQFKFFIIWVLFGIPSFRFPKSGFHRGTAAVRSRTALQMLTVKTRNLVFTRFCKGEKRAFKEFARAFSRVFLPRRLYVSTNLFSHICGGGNCKFELSVSGPKE